jgi:Leucine-rich repeat (LRR) protein
VLLEFLRTCLNARGDKHKHYKITPTLHLDLSRRPYKVLPPEVLCITALTTLKLSNYGMENMVEGISELKNLTHLELHDNRLKGLPDSMHHLTSLQRLSLARNWFKRLPYCLSTLEKLKDLQVDGNQITVIFAEVRNLTSLTELNMRGNCLRQITPALSTLTNLIVLDLSENQLSFVPKQFAIMTNLQRFSLRANYICELPTEWHTLAEGNMLVFDLQRNGLKSPPPEILARGSEHVFEYLRRFHLARGSGVLDLSDMGMTYMPADVMRFYKPRGAESQGLKRLILDGNRISWLPNYLRQMTSLTHISLKNCCFTKLPYFIGDLRELTRLDLYGNDIQSPPDEIIRRGVHAMVRYMRAVDGAWWTKELDISGQRFETVPLEICDVDSLTSLKMHSQYFTDIPAEIGRLTALTHLNLQHCALVEIPDSIGDCYNLRELILNNNKLLTLPARIGCCTGLTDLRLHENLLEELPPAIGSCTLLQDLRLFNNNLLELPLEIGNMVYLPALRVSSNQLTELSIGIGGLEACSDLLAAENYLEALPAQIGLLTNITRLRVSNNRLTSLPTEVGNLYNMTELSVNDNQLRELPALGHLTSLRSLLVANNPLKLPPDRIIRKGTFAIVNYLRVLYEAGGAPPEVVERGQPSVEAFHETVQDSFSKVLYIVTLDGKHARALTFVNLCPGRARLSQSVLARPPARGRAHAGHWE